MGLNTSICSFLCISARWSMPCHGGDTKNVYKTAECENLYKVKNYDILSIRELSSFRKAGLWNSLLLFRYRRGRFFLFLSTFLARNFIILFSIKKRKKERNKIYGKIARKKISTAALSPPVPAAAASAHIVWSGLKIFLTLFKRSFAAYYFLFFTRMLFMLLHLCLWSLWQFHDFSTKIRNQSISRHL